MKTLFAVLLVLAFVVIGLPLIAAALGVVAAVAIPLVWLVVWFLPILIIACSDRTTGGEKLAWILAIVFLSWFAWVFYFLLAPIKPRLFQGRYARRYDQQYADYRYHRHHRY